MDMILHKRLAFLLKKCYNKSVKGRDASWV